MPAEKKSIRDLVASAEDISREIVAVEEWGGVKLEMRGMSTGDRGRFMQANINDDGEYRPNFEAYFADVVIATAYDPETGDKAFLPTDHAMLNAKAPTVLDRLAAIGLKLSGLNEGAVEEGKDDSSDTPKSASTAT